MEWNVKPMRAGLRVSFDRACGRERQRLIDALNRRQNGWRGCPPDQVKKISTSTIRSVAWTVSFDIVAQGTAHLNSREIRKCLGAALQREASTAKG